MGTTLRTMCLGAMALMLTSCIVDDTGDACSGSSSSSCSGDNICVANTCQSAFGRSYTVSVPSLTIAPLDWNGNDWDSFPGFEAPDPVVEMFINDIEVFTTEERSDTYQTSFSEVGEVFIPTGAQIFIAGLDADADGTETILFCDFAMTASDLRSGSISCQGSGTSAGSLLIMNISPR